MKTSKETYDWITKFYNESKAEGYNPRIVALILTLRIIESMYKEGKSYEDVLRIMEKTMFLASTDFRKDIENEK